MVRKAGVFLPFYLLAFVFTLHVASPAYITSTFLAGKIGEGSVGLAYAGASLATLIIFFFIGSLLKKRGASRAVGDYSGIRNELCYHLSHLV